MPRSVLAKEARKFQGHLDGVVIVSTTSIPVGDGNVIPPNTDVTEISKTWPNLPGMIKRGTVVCTPPVDANSIQRGPVPTGPAALKKALEGGGLYVRNAQEAAELKTLTRTQQVGSGGPGDENRAPAPGSEFVKPRGQIPQGEPPPPGVLGKGLALRLADLTAQDSSRHIANVLKEAGAVLTGSKKELLAARDEVLRASAEAEQKHKEAASVDLPQSAGQDAPKDPPVQA